MKSNNQGVLNVELNCYENQLNHKKSKLNGSKLSGFNKKINTNFLNRHNIGHWELYLLPQIFAKFNPTKIFSGNQKGMQIFFKNWAKMGTLL